MRLTGIDTHEVETRLVEHGILNTQTGTYIWCKSREEAEFDALLYPYAAVVERHHYITKPVVIVTAG